METLRVRDMMLEGTGCSTHVVTRFAPSPTGYLHIGHAYSALINFEQARSVGGRFLLRIEDIDRTRCRPRYEAAIFEDLVWLGIDWDEPPLRQSQRIAFYETHLARLRERGLLYRCFKSRKDIEAALRAPHGSLQGPYHGGPLPETEEKERLAQGHPFAWRLSLAAAETTLGTVFANLSVVEETECGLMARPADPHPFGDVVLGRKDSGTSYHLASVLDDAVQGVTHVIRGEDLREAADLHVLLHALFGLKPPVYQHHALITDETGNRLAKRNQSATLRSMREAGISADSVRTQLRDRLARPGKA